MSINARNDGDVDPNLIRRKVQDASGAKYSIHNEQAKPELPPAPVVSFCLLDQHEEMMEIDIDFFFIRFRVLFTKRRSWTFRRQKWRNRRRLS